MEAENIDFRKKKILAFAKVYTGFIFVCILLAYWSFHKIPDVYRRDRTSATSYLSGFLKKSAEVQELTLQIRNKPDVKQSSVVAYYEWVGQLKENYPRKIFVNVLDSYLRQTDDILNKSDKDSVLTALQKNYQLLKSQNIQLTADNMSLNTQLAEKKALLSRP
ncbi:hypothetical protein LZD49_31775 [Dyadobacter sp. CY261]|uniref:hypothetical protein n=1 Tax=Dyadobacter sp. CY261 TaxID=2907203 RepID=UPI001F366E84|nr:hypothetical protein [Dyadobacter sp. CY261]MCF0075107.1 hypothetical protein [Dyadobacter sp. CY261]